MDAHSEWPLYTAEQKEVMNFETDRDPQGPRSASKTVHEDSAEFWNNIVPAIQSHQCQLRPRNSLLTSNIENTELDENTFLGLHMALPTIEYVVLGLVGSTCLLLVLLFLTFNKLVNEKKSSFRRLQ
ncbi:hypothetical protein TNCV_2371691 [Trichonephila clavipes]|nr:hypothetical protein TNCV_2371691 [Trichonephila clavipes]